MGGKKISGAVVEAPHHVVPPVSSSSGVERLGPASLTSSSSSTCLGGGGSSSSSKCGYAGVVKRGLIGGSVAGGGANGKPKAAAGSSPSPTAAEGKAVESGDTMSVKSNGNGTTSSHDVNVRIETGDRPLHEALNDLTLQSGKQAGNTHLTQKEDVFAASVEEAVVDTGSDDLLGSNGRPGGGGADCASSDQWKTEYKPPDVGATGGAASSGGNGNGSGSNSCSSRSSSIQQIHGEYELHRSMPDREFRPPSLILPDAVNIESVDSDYRAPQTLHLPASLVVSPHDGKQILLDPNAREFTPSPSPCPSPVLPPSVMGLVPSPYHMEPPHLTYAPGVELGPVMYSSDYNGGPVMPLYANGGALGYGPIPNSPAPPWENQHMGMGDMVHHLPPGSGPPSMVGQPSPHLMRPYVAAQSMHGYMPSCCSPPIGSPTGNMPGFSVPPPLTGREHVSRALLLSGVSIELPDHQLRFELEQWGMVRALGLERRQEGLVTVHYYDLRHAKEALRDVQQQHLLQQQRMQQKFQQMQKHQQRPGLHLHNDLDKHDVCKGGHRDEDSAPPAGRGLIGGKAVWAQYTVPIGTATGPDSHNQGTLVVFNLDADMPLDVLRAAFEAHGAVKELRETPAKRQHKFVEFYDVRDAARALAALDGHEIGGKRVKIEFSRPGGQARRARAQAQAQVMAAQQASQQGAAAGSMLPLVNNRLSGGLTGQLPGQHMVFGWGADPSMGPAQSMSPLQAPPPAYLWANFSHIPAGPPSLAPLNAIVQQQHQQQQWNVGHGQLQPMPYPPQVQGPSSSPGGLAVAGVPMVNEGGHGRQYARGGRSFNGEAVPSPPGGSNFPCGISTGFSSRGAHSGGPSGRGGCDEPTGRRRRGGGGGGGGGGGACGGSSNSNGSLAKTDLTSLPSLSSISEPKQGSEISPGGSRDSPRSGKTGLTPKSSPREHAQYTFNADQAEQGLETPRTTLMIKNIPNKYNQPMLLALLDQHCLCCNNSIQDPNEPQSAYDFVYLPIDFKNRCNLGYAFVNFTSVSATVKLYKAFHAQQWEAFNSRKICQVTYARVQGRVALEEHFRNSRFACDTDEYLPLVFSPPRTGIVCPPPIVAAGHLAGRALTCSPRAENSNNCRPSRNGDLVDISSSSSTSAGEQSQSHQQQSGGSTINFDDQENEVGASSSSSSTSSSSSNTDPSSSDGGVGVAASYAGRRPNGQHR